VDGIVSVLKGMRIEIDAGGITIHQLYKIDVEDMPWLVKAVTAAAMVNGYLRGEDPHHEN
jgi:hypothetical protein